MPGITPPELLTTNDILDDDILIITHDAGDSETISGADLNKRIQTIIATTKTITGAPLKTGNIVRVMFTQVITALDTTTPLVINYNETDYAVKVGKDGALVSYYAFEVSSGTYKYLQAYTTLEMVYDGTQFVIIGNPVVISDTDYVVYADGDKILKFKNIDNVPTAGSDNPVKSGGIKNAIYITTAESLIHQLVVSTTDTSYQTFLQRKITDYKLLLFEIGTNDSIRITQFIYTQDFINYTNAYFNSAHGANLENTASMETHYVDATHLRFKAGGSGAFNTVNVIGLR